MAFLITLLLYSSYFSPIQTQYPKGILKLFFTTPFAPRQSALRPLIRQTKRTAYREVEPNPNLIFPRPLEKLTPLPNKTSPGIMMSGEEMQMRPINPAMVKRSGPIKPQTPEEYYLIEVIIPAIDYTESYFQERNGRTMTADDWLKFLNKIYPTTVDFSPTKTEENKITYLKSVAAAYAFMNKGYGYQPKNFKVRLTCPSEMLPHALGYTDTLDNGVRITCPQYGLSGITTEVVMHEFLHIITGIGNEGENIISMTMAIRFPFLFINPEDAKKNMGIALAPVELFPEPIYIPFDPDNPPKR